MSLSREKATRYHGVRVDIPPTNYSELSTTFPVVTPLMTFDVGEGDAGGGFVTVESSNPFLSVVPSQYDEIGPGAVDEIDLASHLAIRWTRGDAVFFAEVDLGCSVVVGATHVDVSMVTYYNTAPEGSRKVSVSATRGARPRSAHMGPTYTTRPVLLGNFVRVPPFARAYRVRSGSRRAVQVAEFTRFNVASGVNAVNVVNSIGFDQVHALATDRNCLRFTTSAPTSGESCSFQFLLDL